MEKAWNWKIEVSEWYWTPDIHIKDDTSNEHLYKITEKLNEIKIERASFDGYREPITSMMTQKEAAEANDEIMVWLKSSVLVSCLIVHNFQENEVLQNNSKYVLRESIIAVIVLPLKDIIANSVLEPRLHFERPVHLLVSFVNV